ncbi:MAG TPA: serine hydrolase [Gemmatimonadaceae bacterium]|nr:serine hydrolase [Gemmatimonadaceae bacterium]
MRTLISFHSTAIALVVGALASAPASSQGVRSQSRDVATLRATVEARLDSLQAQSSFYARDLATGREIAVRADVPMNTASVIKIPVLILAFRDADAGRLDLGQRYTIRPEDLRRGTGLLQTFAPGLQPTIRDILTQMIVTSDNTATDIMIAKVGGRDRVNRMLDSLGYRQTRLNMTTGQIFRAVWVQADPSHATMTDREIFERGFPNDSGANARNVAFVADSSRWLGQTTAREIARLLEQLQRGELASKSSTAGMLRILRGQLYASRLPQRIRFRAGIAHKTGDWPPLLGNDVGIVYAANGPIVMAVFTNNNRGDFFDLEATEGKIAEDVLDAWGGARVR